MKHRVNKGIYVFYGSMSPHLAAHTGFSDEDAEAIKSILPRLFENDSSSARPDGSMKVLKVKGSCFRKNPNKTIFCCMQLQKTLGSFALSIIFLDTLNPKEIK